MPSVFCGECKETGQAGVRGEKRQATCKQGGREVAHSRERAERSTAAGAQARIACHAQHAQHAIHIMHSVLAWGANRYEAPATKKAGVSTAGSKRQGWGGWAPPCRRLLLIHRRFGTEPDAATHAQPCMTPRRPAPPVQPRLRAHSPGSMYVIRHNLVQPLLRIMPS